MNLLSAKMALRWDYPKDKKGEVLTLSFRSWARACISVERSPKSGAPLEGLGRGKRQCLRPQVSTEALCGVVAASSETADHDAHGGRAAEDRGSPAG